MPGEGVGQIVVRHQVENRGERLLANNLKIGLGAREAGSDITAAGKFFPAQDFAAVKNFAAFGAEKLEGGLHFLDGRGVNERAHERALVQRVANGHLPVAGEKAFGQFRLDGLVNQDAAGAGAALAGGADGAEKNRARRQLEIGRGRHDDGVVAAQFEEDAAEAF